MRKIKKLICSCGKITEDEEMYDKTTEEEDEKYNCAPNGCCAVAYKCPVCGVRWIFTYAAPEAEWGM